MNESDSVIEVKSVHKAFGPRHVLRGIDLEVRRGETVVILGGSGSGKSTLLRILTGLEPPDRGEVRIFGTDVYNSNPDELAAVRRRIGMAFQDGALFESMTVGENVEFPWVEFTDIAAKTRRIIARIKLGMVGLGDAMDLHPSQLSGGMKKRASLARALSLDPEVVFFDEPSSGLDPVTAAGLDRLLNRLKAAFDIAFIVVTHDLESAFSIADRIALLVDGRFLLVGPTETVRESDDPFVQRFLGRQPPDVGESAEELRQFLKELH